MNFLTKTFGRYLFAIPFAIFGLMHFMAANDMAGMVPLPGGAIWVYFTGLALILAAVSIIIQKKAKLASLLLGVMLIIFVLAIHLPTVLGGDQMAMGSVLKDLSLAGAAFTYSGLAKD
jgi:putative oxidoreductase